MVSSLKRKKILFAAWSCHNKNWHTYQMWDSPLRKLFGKVATFDPQEQSYLYGKEKMNQNFLEAVKNEQPDYIFLWLMVEELSFDTLLKVQELAPKAKIIDFCGDDDIKFEDHTLLLFPFMDYFFLTQPQYFNEYRKEKKKYYFMCGANTEEFRPMKAEKKYDVSFVGTPKGDRIEFLRHLLNRNFKVRVCGAGWEKYPEFREVYGGKIPSDEFVKLINETKINLCLSKNVFKGSHLLERFFEVNSCKAFQLTEYCEGYFPMFKEGKDIASFKDKEELLKKIEYYLTHEKEREAIAKLAYQKTLKGYSSEDLLRTAFKDMEKERTPYHTGLPPMKRTWTTISKKELIHCSTEQIKDLLNSFDYVCFSESGSRPLPYKEYLQMYALEHFNREICCAAAYQHSWIIGDYASICSRGFTEYFGFKKVHEVTTLSQLMVRRDYLLSHLEQFRNFAKAQEDELMTKENTTFITIPLLRINQKITVPYKGQEHLYFNFFEERLLSLKNQGRIFSDVFPYKLVFYALFRNWFILKYLTLYTLKRTKQPKLIAISQFFNKRLN